MKTTAPTARHADSDEHAMEIEIDRCESDGTYKEGGDKSTIVSHDANMRKLICFNTCLTALLAICLIGIASAVFVNTKMLKPMEPPLPGIMKNKDGKTKLILSQDIDYPPFTVLNGDLELSGFAIDFARGMAKESDIDLTLIEGTWDNCWMSNPLNLGVGLQNGWFHACAAFTHTKGVRPRYMDFSYAMLKGNRAAGLLTRLSNGQPIVKGNDDLTGKSAKVADVANWAPSPDGIKFVKNSCTGNKFDVDFSKFKSYLKTGSYTDNDMALKKLLDKEVDLVWVYADQAKQYADLCKESTSQPIDCSLWSQFGKPNGFAYIHSGMPEYLINGTTLAISKAGSGLNDVVNPAMDKFMKTKEYYEVCKKFDLVAQCYENEHFPSTDSKVENYDKKTKDLKSTCADGYCPCPSD